MVKRRGIGATSASAIIFSILLISNLALYVASQNRETLYSQSNAEDSLSDGAATLAGAIAANLLDEEQTILGSATLDCSTAMTTVAGEIGGLSDLQRVGNLTVTGSAEMATGSPVDDNLSMLVPFNGSIGGDLSTALHITSTGEISPARVSLSRSETRFVHLPVRLESASSDCMGAVRTIAAVVSAAIPYNCTAWPVGPLMESASQAPASTAAGDGFGFSLEYSVEKTIPCTVGFRVSVEQSDIQGPVGEFNVQVQEEGIASFGQQSSPPPA